MPVSFENFVESYGYLAILIGTFVEGETIVVLGGFLAHRGYLDLPAVWLAAFAGTFGADQLFFYIGRFHGAGFLDRRPAWHAKSQRVFELLHRHQIWVILGFRFLYGLRTVTPLIIGASRISPWRFFVLNGLGAAVWAVALGTLGYFVGQAMETLLGEMKRYELPVLGGIIGAGVVIWAIYTCRQIGRNK
jgi:membrane protein DedA with SNARE-associated domain